MCIEIPCAHEVSITAKVTVSEGQPTLSVDPEASLRAELLGTIAGAQFDIDNAIAELARSSADTSALTNQRQSLQQMQKQVSSASFATLAGLRAEIAGAVATTQALAEQGRAIATSAGQAAAEALATASANSRAQVTSIIRDMHRFDAYLHFESAEDEAAYRKREAERLAYINAQHAKGTPEGNLNAAGAAVGQLADAKVNGAGDNPEFERSWSELLETTERLRSEVLRSGGSIKAFDDRLRADIRTILSAKGFSDQQIEARLAAHANPLEAVKALVKGEDAVLALRQTVEASVGSVSAQPKIPAEAANVAPVSNLDDAMAKLRSAGIVMAEHKATTPFAHGVSQQAIAQSFDRSPTPS